MTKSAINKEELLQAACSLPPEERLELVRDLLASIDPQRALSLAADLLECEYCEDEGEQQCFNCLDPDEFHDYEER